MATKLAGTRSVVESLGRDASESRTSPRSGWLSKSLKQKWVIRGLAFVADAAALVSGHRVAEVLVQHFLRVPTGFLNPPNYAVLYLPFLLAVLFVFERNKRPVLQRPEKELEMTVKGVSLAFLLLVCANFVVFKTGFSRYLMVSWYVLTLIALLAVRYGLRLLYGTLWQRGIGQKRTLLIGSAERLFQLQTLLTIQRYRGYNLLGIVPAGGDPPDRFEGNALPVLGHIEQWHRLAREHRAEQVIVALDGNTTEAHAMVSDLLKRCLVENIDVQVYSDLFASREFNYELDEFSGFFRFFAAPRWSKRAQIAAKALLDFTAGIVGSLITIAVLPAVALAIKLDDGGPIFYQRELLSLGGRPRLHRKFRTMRTDAGQMLERDLTLKARFEEKHKLVDDPRVTRVGRFLRKYSIDELPEFFMVLTGKLTLVGPRAITRKEGPRYGDCLQKLTSVKPGMTGFWQVMGRQLTTYEERVQMDMFYIDHWSIWLDLWIVAITFVKVIKAEGAY